MRRRRDRSGSSNNHDWRLCMIMLMGCFPTLLVQAQQQGEAQNLFPISTPPKGFLPPAYGPIHDAECTIEDLEEANDSQLYTILKELTETSFFRNFLVDLDTTCPLHTSDDEEEEEFECGGGASDDGDKLGMSGESGFSFMSDDEDDEHHEPLCTVQTGGSGEESFDSNALNSISSSGYTSKDQKETFDWEKQTDIVITDEEGCDDDTSVGLPDTFWMDMCSNIKQGDGTSMVNLPLNPERNTGYNGTHIWEAIYQENCIFDSQQETTTKSSQINQFAFPGDDGNDDDHQCLEQRVLYRLLSGLHTQTTLSIASHYYPPSQRKNRPTWAPNSKLFYERFKDNPEYIRNLHFSYVVMLRALNKAKDVLSTYEIHTGDVVQDEAAEILLRRLLDSSILSSCSSVFKAFDESAMFQGEDSVLLQQNFKGVFHNISSILDCVQCQQCKLHGKLAMLGYGTALKALFIKNTSLLKLERNEIVAFINTIAKLSESIREVRTLTQLYWEEQQEKILVQQQKEQQEQQQQISKLQAQKEAITYQQTDVDDDNDEAKSDLDSWDWVDVSVGLVASLGKKGFVTPEREAELVKLALEQNPKLLILAKHYRDDVEKFHQFSQLSELAGDLASTAPRNSKNVTPITTTQKSTNAPDAIIVGSGLAGLAAALNILDRGGKVVLVEKEHLLGGNSNKASSGINACCPDDDDTNSTNTVTNSDSVEIFRNDTIRSAGDGVQPHLVQILTENSAKAVSWLRDRVHVDLSLKAQLGGHSAQRTHRPSNGMAGAEIIYGMQKAVREYEKTGRVQILVDTKVTNLVTENDNQIRVVGIEYKTLKKNKKKKSKAGGQSMMIDAQDEGKMYCSNIILATGGFASDRSNGSYLEQYRPELMKFPTTAGAFSTGDGVTLAKDVGAGTINMDKVQIHPTGWVDPTDPKNPTKILAAELMRGVGGVLLNDDGHRFCNELGTRAYVTDMMLSHDKHYAKTKVWNKSVESIPSFFLLLSSAAAAKGKKHVDHYTHKGLLTKVDGLSMLAKHTNLSKSILKQTIKKYQDSATKYNVDEFGKRNFQGMFKQNLESETFYVGKVTPVLHYCMGGITIDTEGNVLNGDGQVIHGLHAAGEVTGGVHGNNRLGGNSLLECTVFGTIVGEKIPIQKEQLQQKVSSPSSVPSLLPSSNDANFQTKTISTQNDDDYTNRIITPEELKMHNTTDDCWVAIHGIVYDLTDFAEEHPAGSESIYILAGQDGSEAFAAIHNEQILIDDFEDERIGIFQPTKIKSTSSKRAASSISS